MSLRLVYQDPMGNYFHSLMTTAPLTGAIGFIIVMLFLAVRWLQRQLAGQELLETRATRILNGERGSNVLGTIYEWPPRTSSALDTLLREIQNAREQHSRLDTLIRSYAAQDVKTGLNNRLFFDNQLATLLEDQEKVGTHGIVMMIRLPDFNMLSDTWGHSQVEETALHPDESAVDIYDALPGRAAGALPPQRFRRAVAAPDVKRGGEHRRAVDQGRRYLAERIKCSIATI